ncbi:response regulator [Candidatus Sumerlaeota bacterium]|nr:response regulator [Candidatus Sumerlaeota bacterium]
MSETQQTASPTERGVFTPSLVVVDDDRYIVSLLEEVFLSDGLTVHSFTSSVEAKRHLEASPPDILIADIHMPEVTGLDLLRMVHEQSPETMVIIITGYSSLQTTLEAVQLGAFDYITKPFLLGEVKLVVQRAAEQLALRRDNERMSARLAELEREFTRLQRSFESLSQEFLALSEQRSHDSVRLRVPTTPQQALRPYAAAAQTDESLYEQRLMLLEDLHRRGVLSGKDLELAKRRLAEATG